MALCGTVLLLWFLEPRALGEWELVLLEQGCRFQVFAGVSLGMQNDADHMQIYRERQYLQGKPTRCSAPGCLPWVQWAMGEVWIHAYAFEFPKFPEI